MSTTAERLRELMDSRGLKQIDILRMVEPYCKQYNIKLQKSDLSQFVSGKVQPGQSKLSILGMALNVSESWLMGQPVSMERIDNYDGSWSNHFRKSLDEALLSIDPSDAAETGTNLRHLQAIASGSGQLSLEVCCNACDELGESLDELTGLREKSPTAAGCEADNESLEIAKKIMNLPADVKAQVVDYVAFLESKSKKQ